jgi:hypothetical protein
MPHQTQEEFCGMIVLSAPLGTKLSDIPSTQKDRVPFEEHANIHSIPHQQGPHNHTWCDWYTFEQPKVIPERKSPMQKMKSIVCTILKVELTFVQCEIALLLEEQTQTGPFDAGSFSE